MDLGSINAQIAAAVAGAPAASPTPPAGGSVDFASSLDAALKAVSRSQTQSEQLAQQFAMQDPSVSLEDTIVAMNKAGIAFAAAVQVRNRLVQAYDQIMNMQV